MGIIEGISNIFTSKLTSPISKPLKLAAYNINEEKRVAQFQKLYDYYINDQGQIKLYTQKGMKVSFKPETIERMVLPYFNIVRRIINRLCLAYKLPPVRYVIIESELQGEDIVENPKAVKSNENYQECLSGSNINKQAKLYHRLAKLLDTAYVHPIWREDHLEFDVFPPHQLTVVEDEKNYLLPAEVSYEVGKPDGSIRKIIWSKDVHWVLDDQDQPVEGENPWGGVNQYGVLPFIPLRLRETENHWGEGDTQLVDINEKINILLASSYYNAIMQSHGQAVAINMNLGDKKIQTGPDWIIQAEDVRKDDFPPSFTFVQPQPAIVECMAQIDWYIKVAAMMRGLPASSVSIDEKAESGAAKAIDNWELLEIREDDLEFLRPFEKDLFDVTRSIWNFHEPGKKIDDKSAFGIDFVTPTAPVPEKEELEAKELKFRLGLWTPVDDMIDEDEGIDEDKALHYVMKNLSIKKMIDEAKTPDALQNVDAVGQPIDKEEEEEDEDDIGFQVNG